MSEEQTISYDASNEVEVDENGLREEEGKSLVVGDQMEKQQENLLAGKYKSTEELEKAHLKLQRKLGEKSEPDLPDKSLENDTPDQNQNEYKNILDQLWDEGSQNKLSKDTFNKLEKMSPIEVAKLAMEARQKSNQAPQQREFTDKDVDQIHGLVGGKDNYQNMMSWATQNVPEQEINLFDAVMDRGDPLSAYFAVQALALKYQDASGRDGKMVTGKAPKQTADVFNSQQEMIQAMDNPRYHDDPAYREALLQKLARSNINF